MRKCTLLIMALFIITFTCSASLNWAPGEVLIKMSPDVVENTTNHSYTLNRTTIETLKSLGSSQIEPVFKSPAKLQSDLNRWFKVACTPGISEEVLLERVSSLASVEEAELNYEVYLDVTPDDADYDKQWAWDVLDAERAWDISQGVPQVVVAIIDSGTDMDHEDLVDNIWSNPGEVPGNGIDDDGNGYTDDSVGWDFRGNDNNPDNVNTDNDHGTHVAGIVGAVTNNGIGVAGGSWNCPVMILKVFPNTGGGAWVDDVAEAITYATDNGASVINLSLGGAGNSAVQADAVLYAYNNGLAVLASSGNGGNDGIGDSTPHYPSGNTGAIGVGSTNKFDGKAGSSNYGESWVDIFSPGVAIRSTLPGNNYGNLSGTSMASPVAAGLAALLMSNFPGITPDEVETRMENGCEPINFTNPAFYGELDPGRINYFNSLTDRPIVAFDHLIIDDASGNSNHEADQGETVNLQLYLRNKAWLAGSNIQISATAGAGINFSDNTASYGTMASKEVKDNVDALTFTVTSSQHETITVTVNVTSDAGSSGSFTFDLSVNNPLPNLPGFPVESWGGYNASPRCADLNGDGYQEIITASNDGTINVLTHTGENFPGWPITLMSIQEFDSILILAAPAIADMDMDGDLEIIVADQYTDTEWVNPNDPDQGTEQRVLGRLHIFHHDGTVMTGWPWETNLPFNPPADAIQAGFKAGPTIADIAGDTHPEVILGNYGDHVFAMDYTGQIVSGWPINVGTDVFASASTYDYNSDGKDEIVIVVKDDDDTGPLDSGALYLFSGDGSVYPGFPVDWNNQIYSVPVLADMDGDGIPEIIFGFGDYANEIVPKGLTVMDMRSEPLTGWPVELPDTIYASPGLGDLDQDGDLEIVVCSVGADMYAYHHDGTPVTGFPVTISSDVEASVNSSPAIADLDNDGYPEIIVCSEIGFHVEANVHIFNHDGTEHADSPILINESGFSSPCISDVDNDDDLEIVVTDTGVVVLNVNSDYDADQQYWTTYHGNNRSTGVYEGETPMKSGVNMMITDPMFSAGEAFVLDAVMVNASQTTMQNLDLYVILDVYSMYWFHPSWSDSGDWEDVAELTPGHVVNNIFTFDWPTVAGTAEGLYFWGGLLDESFQLFGDIDYVTFGW